MYTGSTQYLSAECRCARGWRCLTQVSELHGERSPASTVLTVGPLCNLRDWTGEADFSRSTSGFSQACFYRGMSVRQTKKALLLEGPQEASLDFLSGCMRITHIQIPHGPPKSENIWSEPHFRSRHPGLKPQSDGPLGLSLLSSGPQFLICDHHQLWQVILRQEARMGTLP